MLRIIRNYSVTKGISSITRFYENLLTGDRASLAKAITLVESTLPEHREQADQLLSLIMSKSQVSEPSVHGKLNPSFRIGLSGSPGVGKSTFIEALGMMLVDKGHRVAVLAVDPSSSISGGSILGDKTRMMNLSKHESAFVRGSPNSGSLGGIAKNTSEAIILCETAGYDIVLVETVGVGQSETLVADTVDMFILLIPPSGGDELQGIKKGIVELSDLIVINKADGDLLAASQLTQLEYVSALKLLRQRRKSWSPKVMRVSSISKVGLEECWNCMYDFYNIITKDDTILKVRAEQKKKRMWQHIIDDVVRHLKTDPALKKLIQELEDKVTRGELSPFKAAETVLSTLKKNF